MSGSRSKMDEYDHAVSGAILHSSHDASESDYIFEQLARGPDTGKAPVDYIDLRKYAKPSRHQRKRGTCAAFAAASIREIQEHISRGESQSHSPEFIYYHRANKPSEGMFGRDVLMIMRDIGSVTEEMYPYNESLEPLTRPSTEHYALAAESRIANFARVTTCGGLKRAIREVGPCYLVLPLYATRPHFWRRSRNDKDEPSGHSVAVVGYDNSGFILKNSWGPTWNGDGCITFAYSEWNHVKECWAPINHRIKTIKDEPDLKMSTISLNSSDDSVKTKSKCDLM